MKCRHCGQPIEWDSYWTTWDHTGRGRAMTAELCEPVKGFEKSKVAAPV